MLHTLSCLTAGRSQGIVAAAPTCGVLSCMPYGLLRCIPEVAAGNGRQGTFMMQPSPLLQTSDTRLAPGITDSP